MSFSYFNTLNYTLANEDTALEIAILPQGADHVISVCGSGGRVLPLLSRSPKRVTLVDLSQEQLYLAELRFASVRALGLSEFMQFWGYPPVSAEPAERRRMFDAFDLSPEAKEFFQGLFSENQWQSILYSGRWERTIAKLATANRLLTGEKGLRLFGALNRSEHEAYLRDEFPRKKWLAVVALLGNAGVFNALIYKGHFPKKNIPESFFGFYKNTLDRCFSQGPARESFFLQLLFFGRIVHAEGVTIECEPKVYAQAQKALSKCDVRFVKGNILEQVAQTDQPADFLSISDVPSYFSGETERMFLQRCKAGLSDRARVVVRHYLHLPEGCDRTGYRDITSDFAAQIANEKVQVYQVEVLEKEAR
jgi:S-adenosylmethionine-diacylglycerol 3-amino-3-carboxypropyl transferase